MNRKDVDINKVTPMMKQYLEIKAENEDIILFFRLGDFYEMFFEDAITVSHELELTLTGKSAGLSEKIPMCGIPHHASRIYIEKLVNLGHKIGICEQLEDAKDVKGIVKRGIVQIISIGTIIDDNVIKPYENNYIASILEFDKSYSLVYTDISTGLIKGEIVEGSSINLISEVLSLGVSEVIVKSSFDKNILKSLEDQFKVMVTISNNINILEKYSYIYDEITDYRLIENVKLLTTYIESTQKRDLDHFKKLEICDLSFRLKMDIHTKRNLELVETLRLKQRNFSLIWLLDKTKTAMGSRMLKSMIENPLVDIKTINERYDVVEKLSNEFILKDDLKNLLFEVYDLERLCGRVAFSNANAKDLLQLKTSIKLFPSINKILKSINYGDKLKELNELYDVLESSIHENPPLGIKEGYIIKKGFNKELDELKSLRKGGKNFIAKFESDEKIKTGIKNLKVGYNRVFGYYIEISKGNINLVKDEYGYQRKQTLANCERYISPVLKEKEALILNAEEKIVELEYNLFIEVRNRIKNYIADLQYNSNVISKIDVFQSFSTVAEENNYVRPILNNNKVIDIKSSRHPVVEKVLTSEFVYNDIIMDKDTNILLITGPNMAGKSTYMRQLAITIIMAQIGCFVPAKSANMPIFDAIYTRIGASDDLVSGDSTFMVEMKEAANAISNATENSLVLFDELGRGTATFDGMAIAQAIIEYIDKFIHCKTMFSTHYHELTDLEGTLDSLKNIHVSAEEQNGSITFLHKIKEGSVDKSYGIHVARLAKLPEVITKRADDILKVYESSEYRRDVKIQESLDLVEPSKVSVIEEELKDLDILNLTPIEAINKLYELKGKVE